MDAVLQRLTGCLSTPGDEQDVRDVLEAVWQTNGWQVRRLGGYATVARQAASGPERPVLLICAHMDSPGYAVDRMTVGPGPRDGRVRLGLAELGSPDLAGSKADALLKTARGHFPGVLLRISSDEDEPDFVFELEADIAARSGVRQGDRVCFAPRPTTGSSTDLITGPFLDNRLGCWMLTRLSAELSAWRLPCEVVLGATASEEMCGFGARVLAAQVRPDAVIVLDTTYEAAEQGVRLGGGPVLTLSDTSVLISPALRDRMLAAAERAGVPLQTEVYAFSGTDARAFPQQGLTCPVLPLLVPTRGNHTPEETADSRDIETWLRAIRVAAETVWEP